VRLGLASLRDAAVDEDLLAGDVDARHRSRHLLDRAEQAHLAVRERVNGGARGDLRCRHDVLVRRGSRAAFNS
jgi:hypothetical protein